MTEQPEETRQIFTIGFSNLSEQLPFCATVRESLEAAVAEHPNLRLVWRDNAMDDERALANAQEFAALPVDLAIIYHINQYMGDNIRQILTANQKTPIIAIDIPIRWAPYLGVNNDEAGAMAGAVLADWVNLYWHGNVDKVLVLTETRVADSVRRRVDAALETLQASVKVNSDDVLFVDSGNVRDLSVQRTVAVLDRWSEYHQIAMIGFNEETSLALMDAARETGRIEEVVVIGQGASQIALDEMRRPDTRLIASTGYHPESYGPALVSLALHMLAGERVPANNYIELTLFTPDSLADK